MPPKRKATAVPKANKARKTRSGTNAKESTPEGWTSTLHRLDFEALDQSIKKVTEGNISDNTRESYMNYLRQADAFIEAYARSRFLSSPDYLEYADAFRRVTSQSKAMIITFINIKCFGQELSAPSFTTSQTSNSQPNEIGLAPIPEVAGEDEDEEDKEDDDDDDDLDV